MTKVGQKQACYLGQVVSDSFLARASVAFSSQISGSLDENYGNHFSV